MTEQFKTERERTKVRIQTATRAVLQVSHKELQYINKNMEMIYGVDIEILIVYFSWIITYEIISKRKLMSSENDDWILECVTELLNSSESRYFIERQRLRGGWSYFLRDDEVVWLEMTKDLHSFCYQGWTGETERVGAYNVRWWKVSDPRAEWYRQRVWKLRSALMWVIDGYMEAKRSRRIPL